jgi:hypothetical protein
MEMFSTLLPFWPGFAFILFISVLAQVLKKQLLTKEMVQKYRHLIWVKRTYPVILLSLGVFPGVFIPGEVVPGVDLTSEKILFFMGASALSILGFNIFKQWVKNKVKGESTNEDAKVD